MSIEAMNKRFNAFIDQISGMHGRPTPYSERKQDEEDQIDRIVKLANMMNMCVDVEGD